MKLESVVLVKWPRGWVAHIRFDDPRAGADLSNSYKEYLYPQIEKFIKERLNEAN